MKQSSWNIFSEEITLTRVVVRDDFRSSSSLLTMTLSLSSYTCHSSSLPTMTLHCPSTPTFPDIIKSPKILLTAFFLNVRCPGCTSWRSPLQVVRISRLNLLQIGLKASTYESLGSLACEPARSFTASCSREMCISSSLLKKHITQIPYEFKCGGTQKSQVCRHSKYLLQ